MAKFTKEMFAQLGDLSVLDATREDIFKTVCCSSKGTSQSHPSSQPKVVQELQAQDDQNTGNKIEEC